MSSYWESLVAPCLHTCALLNAECASSLCSLWSQNGTNWIHVQCTVFCTSADDCPHIAIVFPMFFYLNTIHFTNSSRLFLRKLKPWQPWRPWRPKTLPNRKMLRRLPLSRVARHGWLVQFGQIPAGIIHLAACHKQTWFLWTLKTVYWVYCIHSEGMVYMVDAGLIEQQWV